MDEKMKDEVKITVIATGFKEVGRGREHAHDAASAALSARTTHAAPASVPQVRAPHLGANLGNESNPVEPHINARPLNAPYVADSVDDYELGSEVVRHAEPVDDTRDAAATYAREAESTYASVIKGVVHEEPPTIETVTSSVNIDYDANDLEIPAFLRKRGDS